MQKYCRLYLAGAAMSRQPEEPWTRRPHGMRTHQWKPVMQTVSQDAVGTTRAGSARARTGVATGTTAWHPAFAGHASAHGGKLMLTATRGLHWTALRVPHARVPPSLRRRLVGLWTCTRPFTCLQHVNLSQQATAVGWYEKCAAEPLVMPTSTCRLMQLICTKVAQARPQEYR